MKFNILCLLLLSSLVIPSTTFAANADYDTEDFFNEGPSLVLTDSGWVPVDELPENYWVLDNPGKTASILAVIAGLIWMCMSRGAPDGADDGGGADHDYARNAIGQWQRMHKGVPHGYASRNSVEASGRVF